jgi:hypothetical protein
LRGHDLQGDAGIGVITSAFILDAGSTELELQEVTGISENLT